MLPDSFRFLDRKVSLVVPYRFDRSKVFLGQFSFSAIARLKPGTTVQQANADVARMIPISLAKFPPFPGGSVKMFEEARITPAVVSLKDDLVGDVRKVLWVLMGTLGLVLLIACANVANLLLVRSESRQQELAIRSALGAGSGRIARELLVESVTLGLAGGAVGLALAFGALRLLVALAPGNLPRIDDITLDVPVLLFTAVLSVVAGLLFGAIPVLRYAGLSIGLSLRSGGRTATAGKDRHRARNLLVVAQVALALVLLVSSGLMIRTFQALRDVHPGIRASRRGADPAAVDSGFSGEGSGRDGADAPDHPRQAGDRAGCDVGGIRVDRHHDRGRAGTIRCTPRTAPTRTRRFPRFACSSSSRPAT